jgi:hypothetical protein
MIKLDEYLVSVRPRTVLVFFVRMYMDSSFMFCHEVETFVIK